MQNLTKDILSTKQIAQKQVEAVEAIRFLDSLVVMGEEAYEIEYEVKRVAAICSELLVNHVSRLAQPIAPPSIVKALPEMIFNWIYLINLSRRSSIRHFSERLVEGFFIQLQVEMECPELVQTPMIYFLCAQLFHTLQAAGVDVKADLRDRMIQACMRRNMKAKPETLTVN